MCAHTACGRIYIAARPTTSWKFCRRRRFVVVCAHNLTRIKKFPVRSRWLTTRSAARSPIASQSSQGHFAAHRAPAWRKSTWLFPPDANFWKRARAFKLLGAQTRTHNKVIIRKINNFICSHTTTAERLLLNRAIIIIARHCAHLLFFFCFCCCMYDECSSILKKLNN